MSFSEIIELAKITALDERLTPSELSFWKKACRSFSKKFHTPLKEVLGYNPEFVMSNIFSDQLDDIDLSEPDNVINILDQIKSIKDPNYDVNKEKELREEMKRILDEEERRIALGETIHHSIQPKDDFKKLPKSGGLNTDLINQLNRDEET